MAVLPVGQLLLLERVHAPEAVVLGTVQLPVLDEAAERCSGQLLTGLDVASLPASWRGCHTAVAGLPATMLSRRRGSNISWRRALKPALMSRFESLTVSLRSGTYRAHCCPIRRSAERPCAVSSSVSSTPKKRTKVLTPYSGGCGEVRSRMPSDGTPAFTNH